MMADTKSTAGLTTTRLWLLDLMLTVLAGRATQDRNRYASVGKTLEDLAPFEKSLEKALVASKEGQHVSRKEWQRMYEEENHGEKLTFDEAMETFGTLTEEYTQVFGKNRVSASNFKLAMELLSRTDRKLAKANEG
jgi:hypothetical protein